MPPRTTDRSGAHHHVYVPARLVWDDSLATGAGDRRAAQDPCLYTLNEAGEKLGKGAGLDDYEAITQQLLSYALYHFDTEEALMQACGYEQTPRPTPNATRPSETGASPTRVMAVRDDLKAGILPPPDPLLGFLNSWLLDHIMLTDKRLATFILARREGTPPHPWTATAGPVTNQHRLTSPLPTWRRGGALFDARAGNHATNTPPSQGECTC